jgi:hypothetical protein
MNVLYRLVPTGSVARQYNRRVEIWNQVEQRSD